MKCLHSFLSVLGSAALSLFALAPFVPPAISQTSPPAAGSPSVAPKPLARKPFRSARLTFIEGDVRIEQANSTANSAAVINMPLVEGTVVSCGPEGQAEVEFEDGSLVRLTPNSGLSLLNLSVDSSGNFQTRVSLLGGLAYFELRAGTKYVYSVDVAGNMISPSENTTFRVNFDESPASVAVLDGSAMLSASGKTFLTATAGQSVDLGANADNEALTIKSAIAPESWDRWNEDRDDAASNEAAAETDARTKFAGNQGYGWSDLDANGSWYDVPGHGEVWQPDLAATPGDDAAADDQGAEASGFDPYGYGSWAWTPAGYSWASGYGWGWLPYRCGLWSYYSSFGWGWSPNSYCGVYGFGGYGYGGLNFGTIPGHYRRPIRPIPGPGPIHPILRGHGGPVPVGPAHRIGGERIIAGNTVEPLQPVGSGLTQQGGISAGAALRRDYPIDRATHAPVLGLAPATHGVTAISNARNALHPGDPAFGSPRETYSPAQRYDSGSRPAPVNRPYPEIRPYSAPIQRQQPAPPPPRYSPPPAPRSAPAPSSPPPSKGK